MNRLKKAITVHFFSIEAQRASLDIFASTFKTSKAEGLDCRILSIKGKKYLIKILDEYKLSKSSAFGITVIRERNTWQAKATSDGKISGISSNQGIIGDPYFFLLDPKKQVIMGFTSGPSGSLKSVGRTILEQFISNRKDQIKLNLIPKKKEFSALRELPEYSSLHFKINSSSLVDISDDAPELIKNLSAAPYIENNMQLSLDLELNSGANDALTKDNIIEIINFLSDHDGCSLLKVKGIDDNGSLILLDFGNAFLNYKTEISTRNTFIDEESALNILKDAFTNLLNMPKIN